MAQVIHAELTQQSANWAGQVHVVNLTMLPHTDEDLAWLDARLGAGAARTASRAHGACRIRATAMPLVWRVQLFDAADVRILDSFQVTDMPEMARTSPEDLFLSAARLQAVLGTI